MTPSQKFTLYLPAWGRVVSTHEWRMRQRRLVGQRRESWGGPATSEIYARTWQHAETLARRDCRAVRPDDLRHGVHVAALGRDLSSTDLRDAQLDRVLVALRLLADPEDLDAMIAWEHPEQGERKRRAWWLANRCHPVYVARVAADMFGVADWTTLTDHQVGILYGRLKHRPGAARRAQAAAAAQPQPRHPDDEAFAAAVEMLQE